MPKPPRKPWDYEWYPRMPWQHPIVVCRGSGYSCSSFSDASDCNANQTVTKCFTNFVQQDQNQDGITVKGSESHQQFHTVTVGELDPAKHSICIKLVGKTSKTSSGEIVWPLFVDTKPTCETCGRTNASSNKYCSNCGTALF